ncbi:hypothetical protein L3X38_024151 [Prunus dulcis]|uniref:Ubiquitin thioesterase OTU n=1 Tax=Prunus dulcis TaxID=3755 RepID=A0AAD4W0C7_PRUDU|nr:hypothetical protein L3X38_024151 [Prunus dulcis]
MVGEKMISHSQNQAGDHHLLVKVFAQLPLPYRPKRKKQSINIYNMEGIVVRRAIPSDNSCLFNVVGYAVYHDKKKAPELRQSIVLGFLTLRSGEEKYSERALLIYDGLHYDALALMVIGFCIILSQMSPFEGAPEEFDQTIFAVKDSTIGPVEGLALNLVKEEQSKRRYTDTANFTLCCGVC